MADHLRSASRTAHTRTPGGALVHQLHRLLSVRALPGHHAGHLRRALVSLLLFSPGGQEVGSFVRMSVPPLPTSISLLALVLVWGVDGMANAGLCLDSAHTVCDRWMVVPQVPFVLRSGVWGACGVLEKTEERGRAVELEGTWLELSWKVLKSSPAHRTFWLLTR